MRIAVLSHNLRFAGGLSVGKNVIGMLRRVADEHEYLLILPTGAGYESIELPTRSKSEYFQRKGGPAGAVRQLWYELFTLERRVRAWRPDVVWGLGNFGLKRPGCPQALLCHQPYFVYDPQEQPRQVWSNGPETRIGRWRMVRSLPATGLVFCQTRTMMERFRTAFQYRGAMALMPNAVSRYAIESAPTRPKVFDQLGGKFVLFCLTRFYHHKNLDALIEMFKRHSEELADVVVILTVDAKECEVARLFLERTREASVRRHFISVGTVAQHELAGYFRHSRALILPTVLESFSGTYVEAMQFQTPILTSDMDFAREICGDAALYFDPWDVRAICAAIERLRGEPELGPELVRCGARRLQTYCRSWDGIVSEAMEHLTALAATALAAPARA